jgi:hypothetical protein
MVLQRIQAMLQACGSTDRVFPPTVLYNENWLLRLVLDWFSSHNPGAHPLAFAPEARWYSEAWLPSAFLARSRCPKDLLAEGWSHADGVIGHFKTGKIGKADLSLLRGATQLVVLEGKIYSRLSSGVTNARYYDQAARTVGCMAEVLKRADRSPREMTCLAFYVLAPRTQIEDGIFSDEVSLQLITRKVQRRADEYGGVRDEWLHSWFEPMMQCPVQIGCLAWEDIIATIKGSDAVFGSSLDYYYDLCRDFNQATSEETLG